MAGLQRTFLLGLAGLVLSGLLVWAVVFHIRAVETGTELIFEAEGYDPRSLLSGHYAQVMLPIGRISAFDDQIIYEGLADETWVPKGAWRGVYVVLAPAGEGWRVAQIGPSPIRVEAPRVVVRADARLRGDIEIRYGIERVYAQKAEAEALEDHLRSPDTVVKIVASLGGDKRLRLKGVIVDGERRDFAWW